MQSKQKVKKKKKEIHSPILGEYCIFLGRNHRKPRQKKIETHDPNQPKFR